MAKRSYGAIKSNNSNFKELCMKKFLKSLLALLMSALIIFGAWLLHLQAKTIINTASIFHITTAILTFLHLLLRVKALL